MNLNYRLRLFTVLELAVVSLVIKDAIANTNDSGICQPLRPAPCISRGNSSYYISQDSLLMISHFNVSADVFYRLSEVAQGTRANCSTNLLQLLCEYIYPTCDEEDQPQSLCINNSFEETITHCHRELNSVQYVLENDIAYKKLLDVVYSLIHYNKNSSTIRYYSNESNYSSSCFEFRWNNLYATSPNEATFYIHLILSIFIVLCVTVAFLSLLSFGICVKYILSKRQHAKELQFVDTGFGRRVRNSTLARIVTVVHSKSKYENKMKVLEMAPEVYRQAMSEYEEHILQENVQISTFFSNGRSTEIYQGYYTNKKALGTTFTNFAAVKRFKENTDPQVTAEYIKKCMSLQEIDQPNVLKFIGVSYDAQFGILLVYPFFEHYDLLSYLRKIRSRSSQGINLKHLYDITVQIALGMKALADHNILHTMLSTKTCLVNQETVVVVGDLSYTHHCENDAVNWLPPEALSSANIYNEKSDVWSFGVTGWEIWSLGEYPYNEIFSKDNLLQLIQSGHRLEKPSLCPQKLYKLFLSCWKFKQAYRPSFCEIVLELDSMKEDDSFQEGQYAYITDDAEFSKGYLKILPNKEDISGDGYQYVDSTRGSLKSLSPITPNIQKVSPLLSRSTTFPVQLYNKKKLPSSPLTTPPHRIVVDDDDDDDSLEESYDYVTHVPTPPLIIQQSAPDNIDEDSYEYVLPSFSQSASPIPTIHIQSFSDRIEPDDDDNEYVNTSPLLLSRSAPDTHDVDTYDYVLPLSQSSTGSTLIPMVNIQSKGIEPDTEYVNV